MKEFHPRSGCYLVELGLAGEGGRGLQPALLACSQLTSTLLGQQAGSLECEAGSCRPSPS